MYSCFLSANAFLCCRQILWDTFPLPPFSSPFATVLERTNQINFYLPEFSISHSQEWRCYTTQSFWHLSRNGNAKCLTFGNDCAGFFSIASILRRATYVRVTCLASRSGFSLNAFLLALTVFYKLVPNG